MKKNDIMYNIYVYKNVAHPLICELSYCSHVETLAWSHHFCKRGYLVQ